MARTTISYIHPTLGELQIKGVQEVHVTTIANSSVVIIAYRSAKGEHVKLTTNVPFFVREGEDENAEPTTPPDGE